MLKKTFDYKPGKKKKRTLQTQNISIHHTEQILGTLTDTKKF